MTRDRDASGAAGAASSGRVPGCGTGPAGRVAFVARELADLWREVRGHGHFAADPDAGRDAEK